MDMDYAEGIVSETGEDAAKKVLTVPLNSMVPLANQTTIVGDFAVPLKGAARYAKIAPLVGLGLAANDTYNGYANTPNVIRNPNTLDELAGAGAGLAHGVSFGLVPEREGTQFLSKLFNGYRRDEASPIAEELQRNVDAEQLEAVRQNVLNNITRTAPIDNAATPAREYNGLADMVLLEDKYRQLTKKDA